MPISPLPLIEWLQGAPADLTMFLLFIFCNIAILLCLRLFGAMGIMLYASIAFIAGNLQALTATQFSFMSHPVALGTVAFSSLFLCSDILTEYYGKAKAQTSVWLSFTGMLLITGLMILTVSYPTVSGGTYDRFKTTHDAIATLFIPAPAILIASLAAYVVAQFNDIWIFSTLSRLTKGKLLWLRTTASTLIGAFIDNLIFSSLAWVILAPTPLDWQTTFYTYILGTYVIRCVMAICGVPLLYASRYCLPTRS